LPDEDNRRFYPFKVGVIDLTALKRDCDQLHAEAVAAVRSGEDAVIPSHLWAAAGIEQKKRRLEDPWEDAIGDAIRHEIMLNDEHTRDPKKFPSHQVKEILHKGKKVWFIASASILSNILQIDKAQQHGVSGRRARSIMGRLGWESANVKINGHTTRGFIYDLAAKGLGAGEWGHYRDALDDDSELAATPDEGEAEADDWGHHRDALDDDDNNELAATPSEGEVEADDDDSYGWADDANT
jgi:hypothetical protein